MSESDSSSEGGISDRPGLVLVAVVIVGAIAILLAGVFLFDIGASDDDDGPSAPQAVMSLTDAPGQYRGEEYLPTAVFNINHDAGESLAGDELRIEIRNRSDDSLVVEWSNGEQTGGSADGIVIRLKRGQSAGEETETFATSTAVETKTITTGDTLEVVDVGAADFSVISTYEVTVYHSPSGEELFSGTTGVS